MRHVYIGDAFNSQWVASMVALKFQSQLISVSFSRLTRVVCLGTILVLMFGCTGDGNSPTDIVVVASADDSDANASTQPDADGSGNANTTGSGSEGDAGTVGGSTASNPPATTTTGVSTDNGSSTDAADSTSGETTGTTTDSGVTTAATETDTAGSTANGGMDSAGTSADAGTTAGTATDAGTEAGTTTGTSTGTSTDSGVTTAGSETDTAGSTTNGGLDTVGTAADAGTTAGTTTGAGTTAGSTTDADTTAGSTTDAGTTTGSTTSGTTSYPVGSLAYLLANQADLSIALAALQAANLDESINDSINEWTLFLPTNDVIEASDAEANLDLTKHMSAGIFSLDDLSEFDGLGLKMVDERSLTIYGGGDEAVTIADATVIRGDIVGNTGSSIVHVIDTVIGDYTGPEYPRGSLADKLVNRGDMSIVLNLLKADKGRDVMLIDPAFEWTLFLPDDLALEGEQDRFLGDNHIYGSAVLKSTDLTGLIGTTIEMFGGYSFEIGGGGTAPLTIGEFNIIETDLRNDAMNGVVVHIIDGVLVP